MVSELEESAITGAAIGAGALDADAITEVIVGELGIVGTEYSFELSESCDVPATLDATTANL